MAKKQTRPTFVTPEPYFTKGGQGKLFRDPKPTEEHRYQRGYTPERADEVLTALHGKLRTQGRFGEVPRNAGLLRRHFVESLARSTMPTSALSNMKMATVHDYQNPAARGQLGVTDTPHPTQDIWITDPARQDPEGMSYGPGVYKKNQVAGPSTVNMFRGAVLPQEVSESQRNQAVGLATVHEIGHVQDAKKRPMTFVTHPTGNKEARADAFMVKHFRHDPRDVRQGRPTIDPETFTYPARGVPIGHPASQGYPNYATTMHEHMQRKDEEVRQRMRAFNDRRMQRSLFDTGEESDTQAAARFIQEEFARADRQRRAQ